MTTKAKQDETKANQTEPDVFRNSSFEMLETGIKRGVLVVRWNG